MPPRVYLIGTGVISHHHAQARATIPGSGLFAADPNPEARARFQAAFPDARLHASSEEMLAAPAGPEDLVVVATPPSGHAPEARKALESGRSVLIEKPIAMDVAEAEALLALARRRGLHIATCANRFQSWTLTRAAADRLRAGELGEILLVDWIHRAPCQRTGLEYQPGSWWFLDRARSGGGTLMDWGPYDFNVLLSLFPAEAVTVDQALVAQADVPAALPPGVVFDVETQVTAALTLHASGRDIRVRYERTSACHAEAMELAAIHGSRAYLTWDWLPYVAAPRLTLRRTTGPKGAAERQDITVSADHAPNWVFEPLRQFHAFLRGEPAQGMFDERALHPLRVIQALYASAATRRPVRVELPSTPSALA